MEPSIELIDEIYRERVRTARRMSPAARVLAGLEMFDLAIAIMADGVRARFPDADDRRVQAILREQLALIQRLEDTA